MSAPALGERHHADRLVTAHPLGDRLVVTKTYAAADAAEIHAAMVALWASPFGADRTPPGLPEPLALAGSSITMAFVGGPTLGRRGDAGATTGRLEEVAHLLAGFHGSGVTIRRTRTPSKLVRSLRRKAALVTPALGAAFEAAVDAVEAISPGAEPLVPSHGDFSPRNLLDTPDGLVLIDFDRLQMAGRGRDVAYLGAWLWVTDLERGQAPGWAPADRLLTAYAAPSGTRLDLLRGTAAFHRAAALLRIAQSWSSLQHHPDRAAVVVAEAHRVAADATPSTVAP